MDKVTTFQITGLVAAALLASRCDEEETWTSNEAPRHVAAYDTAVCVDEAGQRVPDENCGNSPDGRRYMGYYLRSGAPIPYYGDNVNGAAFTGHGSFTRTAGTYCDAAPASTRMTRSAAVARSGLGSSARRFGGRGG